MNTDTKTSPGIGLLGDAFSDMGGCIIDIVGLNGNRVTAQIAASRMFKGWVAGYEPTGWPLVPPVPPWKVMVEISFDGPGLVSKLGGGITKANFRITLYDGDSGSPNPVYQAMFPGTFGPPNTPYLFVTSQPSGYDFDGGNNLEIGFENTTGTPVICGHMGTATTHRLNAGMVTIDTFTGFPGCFALTDPSYATTPHPPQYMNPVQPGVSAGIWPATGWFSVPSGSLSALYSVLLTGDLKIGINDPLSSGDQYYDFTQGLAGDVSDIPFPVVEPSNQTLDLWVWRELNRFADLTTNLNFPPGFEKALLYALMVEMFTVYPSAAAKYDFDELLAEAEGSLAQLEILHGSNAQAVEAMP